MANYGDGSTPNAMLWTGRVMSGLVALMLIMTAVMKFLKPEGFSDGMTHLGWNEGLATTLGIIELVCVAVYLIPRTSILGAILLTGYLGGATATHVRVGDQWFLTVILGVIVWGGLWFRCARLRALIPLRS